MRKSGSLAAWFLVAPALLFLAVFFVGPLILNIRQSLSEPGGGIGFGQYGRVLLDAYYLGVAADTVLLSAAVTAAALVLGYPLGYAIARSSGLTKSFLIFLVVTPLLINVVVRTFGWMVVFGRSGVLNAALKALGLAPLDLMGGWTAITVALVHVLLPFMVLSIASSLEMIDAALEDAAETLGARPWRRFVHVTLPLSLEGVVTGSLLVFALAMGSFVTVMLMGGNATMVLPLLMYQQLTVASDWPFAAALGGVLLVVVLVILWLQTRLRGRAMAR